MSNAAKKTTKTEWKKSAVHNVLCPSGVRVDVKVIDLPRLVETGAFPQHLLDVALKQAGGNEPSVPTVELVKQEREFTDMILMLSVVDPKLEAADMVDIPFEDKTMLVEIATRVRDYDAEGAHIAGLDTSARFRKFRGFPDIDENVEGS